MQSLLKSLSKKQTGAIAQWSITFSRAKSERMYKQPKRKTPGYKQSAGTGCAGRRWSFRACWRTASPRRSRSRPGTRGPAGPFWSPWRSGGSRPRSHPGAAAAGGSRPSAGWTWPNTHTR